MLSDHFYPIGTPGVSWQQKDIDSWREMQKKIRSYDEVLELFKQVSGQISPIVYGTISYASESYELIALRSMNWDNTLPVALITGGVHGYETSGIMAPFKFIEDHIQEYAGKLNLLIAPCVSPWAYERCSRWNYDAVDPNRQFHAEGRSAEAAALTELVLPLRKSVLVHIDLHETTDSDHTEFRPALAARDGLPLIFKHIPDGFYLVSDTANSCPAFQNAIIESVSKVTHIAPSDENGLIMLHNTIGPGVIELSNRDNNMCSTVTEAKFTTTTEVYPDSKKTNPDECVQAQVASIKSALDFALAHQY